MCLACRCVLRRYVASTVSWVLSVRNREHIEDLYAEISSAPSMAKPTTAYFGGRAPESEALSVIVALSSEDSETARTSRGWAEVCIVCVR